LPWPTKKAGEQKRLGRGPLLKREALEDQLAEERERRIQLENELAEFKEDH